MREFDSRYIDGVLDGGGNYQLDVDVNSVTFTHHHLFSREHVLATRLSQLYNQYSLRCNKNLAHFLTDKVTISYMGWMFFLAQYEKSLSFP